MSLLHFFSTTITITFGRLPSNSNTHPTARPTPYIPCANKAGHRRRLQRCSISVGPQYDRRGVLDKDLPGVRVDQLVTVSERHNAQLRQRSRKPSVAVPTTTPTLKTYTSRTIVPFDGTISQSGRSIPYYLAQSMAGSFSEC